MEKGIKNVGGRIQDEKKVHEELRANGRIIAEKGRIVKKALMLPA
jgi:hypothetical protein